MRILKYIFLLLLLCLVALSIFIATQKGEFTIERSKIINSPKSAVFNYVNDYRNWADFGAWTTEDPEIKVDYPAITIGKDASYSWQGNEGAGKIQTLFVKENDSIVQKMDFNGTSASIFWSFKDTVGGTKVIWRSKGKMSFLTKIYTTLNGGVDNVIGTMYEKSLANLDKALDYEINTFSIKINGLVKKPKTFYLAQTFTSELAKVNTNTKIVVPIITTFCDNNDIVTNGKPFVIYHTYDLAKGLAKISICVPIKKEIFISPGSDIISGKLEASEGVQTTVTGDYSHVKKGYDKSMEFIIKNQLQTDPLLSHIQIFSTGKNEVKNSSKWVTQVFIPVLSTVETVKPFTPAPIKRTNTVSEAEIVPTSSITAIKVNTQSVKPTVKSIVNPIIKPVARPIIKPAEPKKLSTPKPVAEEFSEF